MSVFVDKGFFFTIPPRSLMADLIRLAGGRDAAADASPRRAYPLARLRAAAPNVYLRYELRNCLISSYSVGGGGGSNVRNPPRSQPHFQTQGLILAGGFVRHPVNWAVRMAGLVSSTTPPWVVKLFCDVYAWYARFRHKRAPETLASIGEFVANRTVEADRRAIVHRYVLITDNDFRPVARQFGQPVYYLAGLVDPLVPWCYVRWWLRGNCPGYRGGQTVWRADHNVLGTAPQKSAQQILAWIADPDVSQHDS